jgi:hypothetical protein
MTHTHPVCTKASNKRQFIQNEENIETIGLVSSIDME